MDSKKLPQKVPPKVRKAILKVLDYSWADEARHAEETLCSGGDLRGHHFCQLVVLHNFLYGTDKKPKEFLDL